MDDFSRRDVVPESPEVTEIPRYLDVLPDGREVVVIGDKDRYKDFNHLQGDNPYGYRGTCGLVSCQDILLQFGFDVSEADVVGYAIENGLCDTAAKKLENRGGTTVTDQVQILNDFGVPAHYEVGGSLDKLAGLIEQDRGVIVELNAGVLWNDRSAYDQGFPNHAVTITSVARDPSSGEIVGFFINDSGSGESARFVDAATMQDAWAERGGALVTTDIPHTR